MSALVFSPWYINARRLSILTKQNIGSAVQVPITANTAGRVDAMYGALRVSQSLIESGRVPQLADLIARGKFPGSVFAGIWSNAIFAGAAAAHRALERGKPLKKPTVTIEVIVGEQLLHLKGPLEIEHFYSSSSFERLSGRRQFYFVGDFDVDTDEGKYEFFPLLIGDLIEPIGDLRMNWSSSVDVYPGQIDAFAKMSKIRPPAESRLNQIMQNISEKQIKHAFAEIIGEPYVPKDWGGERSDLFSSRVTIDGVPITTAFLLKGPSIRGPMHIADAGQRGDQIVRLFEEPADLLVIQHVNKIETAVRKDARQHAIDPNRPRKFCIIDGASTYSILRAYGYIDNDGKFAKTMPGD